MRLLFNFITIIFFAASAFAAEGEASKQLEDFRKVVNVMKERAFSQNATQTGKGGIKITCTVMPSPSLTAVAWEISNPNNKPLDIKPGDISLYAGSRKFRRMSPDQAVDVFCNWGDNMDSSNDSQEGWENLSGSPGNQTRKTMMRAAAFKFGESSESSIAGITYFGCRLRDLDSVTAEIKVDSDTLKFPFVGGRPPQQ